MTYLEKFVEDYPNLVLQDSAINYCAALVYEDVPDCLDIFNPRSKKCQDCWNQQIKEAN